MLSPPFKKYKILYFIRFRRKAFVTTLTELKAIAAPATQGASRPIAAIGYLQHCNQTPKIDFGEYYEL